MNRALLAVIAAALTTACLTPGEAPMVDYFEPPLPAAATTHEDGRAPPLRLAYVESAAHLRERIVWRESDSELGYHELRRWAEVPVTYVERALRAVLFESGAARDTDLGAPELRVTLLRFDELLRPDHAVQVEVLAQLELEQGPAVLERRFSATRAVDADDPALVATAMGEALSEVVAQVAEQVLAHLPEE